METPENENPIAKGVPSDILIEAMAKFMDYYEPVADADETFELMTTSEIAMNLEDLISNDDINHTHLYLILKENGFSYKYMDGFKWMLRIRPNQGFI